MRRRTLVSDLHLGLQSMGEEASTQEKGRISSQDLDPGTMVDQNTTIKYYISKGTQDVSIPDVSGTTGIDAQQQLEDLGLVVQVQKVYSEADDTGSYPQVDPGYSMYTEPSSGTDAKSGDSVTLYVSRGLDFGDSAEVPYVVGMQKNDALTTLGKFIDITINEQKSTDVAAGEVISQDPVGGEAADPDQPMTITISTGDQEPGAQADTSTDSVASADNSTSDTASSSNDTASQAAAAGEVWECTQRLNTPTGYNGGSVRLELVQEVGGVPTASVIVEGQKITFPYQLDITGAPGVSEGTLYLSEEVDGSYQELGHYPITFEKAE